MNGPLILLFIWWYSNCLIWRYTVIQYYRIYVCMDTALLHLCVHEIKRQMKQENYSINHIFFTLSFLTHLCHIFFVLFSPLLSSAFVSCYFGVFSHFSFGPWIFICTWTCYSFLFHIHLDLISFMYYFSFSQHALFSIFSLCCSITLYRSSRTVWTPMCPETICCGIPYLVVSMHYPSILLTLPSSLFTMPYWVSSDFIKWRVWSDLALDKSGCFKLLIFSQWFCLKT